MYGNWDNPFPVLVGAFFGMALGLVPFLALIAFVRSSFLDEPDDGPS